MRFSARDGGRRGGVIPGSVGDADGDRIGARTVAAAVVSVGLQSGGQVARDLNCAGGNGFVLILDDHEARGGDGFIHWAAFANNSTVSPRRRVSVTDASRLPCLSDPTADHFVQ